MKLIRILAMTLLLPLALSIAPMAFAEEESGDSVSQPEYDYTITYGYTPLVYDGVEAADYVKGKTPDTAYLKAGDNHVVSANYYTFRDYVFAGWRCNGKLYQKGEIIYNVNSDMKLIAEWKRPERPSLSILGIISYEQNGKITETKSVEVGTSVTLKDGYWKDSCGRIFEGGSIFLLSFTVVDFVPAAKGVDTVSVRYNGDGITEGIQSAFKVEKDGSFMVDGCYGNKDGYSFSGWSDGNGRVYLVGDTCVATGDITLTALWRENAKPAPDYCTVNLNVGNGGQGVPAGKSTIEKGKSFSFKVTAVDGYKLVSVTADGAELGTVGEYTLTVNADMSINASFEKLPEPVTDDSKDDESAESFEITGDDSENSVTDNSVDESEDDAFSEEEGSFGRTLFVIIATVVCVVAIAVAGWFSAKSNSKRKRK